MKYVVFQIDNQEYCTSIEVVVSIEKYNNMNPKTKIPKANTYIDCITEVRGKVTSLINIHKIFGKEIKNKESCQVVIVNYEDLLMGIITDHAKDIIDVNEDYIDDKFNVIKLDDRLINIVDVNKLINENIKTER